MFIRRLVLLALACAAAWSCSHKQAASVPITVHAASNLAFGTNIAAGDLVTDLTKMGGSVTRTEATAPACTPGQIHIAVLGHEVAGAAPLAAQSYVITDASCGTGRLITLRGGSHLSAQWAVYDLLNQLGVRYLHPEQTLYPTKLVWPASVAVTAQPAFEERSIHAHTTHPIELLAPKDTTGLDMAGIQKRWVDWNVKLRQTSVDGLDGRFVGTYQFDRGFGRGAGLNLLESQQGGVPLLDPVHPEQDEMRISSAIDDEMKHVDGLPDVTSFGFLFNPSEFTEADDQQTVHRLDFITNYMTQHYPGVRVSTINHGTAGKPTTHYNVRFYDLPEFAPPQLGVSVHTLMFYDLERAAPVYGNENFNDQLYFTLSQAKIRRITHYPESSWWLTFDQPVPLYLAPVTLEARQHDLDLLHGLVTSDPNATSGVNGHELFSSGQEWGYWLIDWCVGRMVWDLNYTYDSCLADFTGALAKGDEIRQVLKEVEARQVVDLRNPEILRFLVGSDDATEAAWSAGIQFHPLPPQPKDVLSWSNDQIAALQMNSLIPLTRIAEDYHAWAARIAALLPAQSTAQAPFVREIHDGLEVFALRAEHAAAVYYAVIALRGALKANDLAAVELAHDGVARAKAITDKARAVITAREADYRYPPQLTIVGDEVGTPGAVPNDSIYPYRYLSRTHRLFYWTRPDDELGALFGDGLNVVQVSGRIFRQALPLTVSVLDQQGTALVAWGDGTMVTENPINPHTYAMQGLFKWVLDGRSGTSVVHHEDQAAAVARRMVFPLGSLKVQDPMGAALLNGLLPGFEIGLGDDGSQFLVLGRVDDNSGISTAGTLQRHDWTGSATSPADLTLELKKVGRVTIRDAVIKVDDGMDAMNRQLTISGTMQTGDVVNLLVQVGGFDQPGAQKIVAEVLGVDTLPDSIPFTVAGMGMESD